MKLLTFALIAIVSIANADLVNDAFNGNAQSFTPFVGNGVGVKQGALPHHCTIFIRAGQKWSFISGSLIAPNLVLTLAKPFIRVQEVLVYYGSTKLNASQKVRGKRLIRHPDVMRGVDLGILELREPILNLGKPIALPPSSCANAPLNNFNVVVAGFGARGKFGL